MKGPLGSGHDTLVHIQAAHTMTRSGQGFAYGRVLLHVSAVERIVG